MEKAARQFTGWVLAIHLMVFGLLVVMVGFASREVYYNARTQALEQVKVRQEMLAAQTGRGIESFYRGILDNLEMQQRAGAMDVTPLIWEQLRGQVAGVSVYDRATLARVNARKDAPGPDAGPPREWLQSVAALGKPGIDAQAELAFAPAGDRLIVASVPVRAVESRFLNDLNKPDNIASMLVDDRMRVLSAEERGLVGVNVLTGKVDPRVRRMAGDVAKGVATHRTREFLEPVDLEGVKRPPALVTVQPVDLPDGSRWWLVVSSSLAEVDHAVGAFFRRAIVGAAIVILVMTGVLVSTSIQLIRGRLRLERLRHEMLDRELAQAREIQLAWLPEKQESQVCADVAAMNRPASHVSGDFYNWFELRDGRVCIVVGDVTGHGLPAAFLMATTQLLVRMTMDRVGDSGAALRDVNRQLCTHVFSGQFVTMLVAVLNAKENVLEVANAGHPPPLVGSGAEFSPIKLEPQLVLAVDDGVEYRTQRFDLPADASVVLYTDGITDVQAPNGDRLGIDGFARSLYGRFSNAAALVDAALDAVDGYRVGREPADDLTVVAVQLTCASATGAAPLPESAPPLAAPAT
jgi:serine phosphatase RsbU (regulator of sigma subunit)